MLVTHGSDYRRWPQPCRQECNNCDQCEAYWRGVGPHRPKPLKYATSRTHHGDVNCTCPGVHIGVYDHRSGCPHHGQRMWRIKRGDDHSDFIGAHTAYQALCRLGARPDRLRLVDVRQDRNSDRIIRVIYSEGGVRYQCWDAAYDTHVGGRRNVILTRSIYTVPPSEVGWPTRFSWEGE
jgi:hypothetical protein